jgi:hypothetical protein
MKNAFGSGLLVAAIALVMAVIDPSFFAKDDFQLEFLPASHEIAQAWASGEFPLLTRASWMCTALAAEYQFGVFSIFRMLLEALAWLLPLSLAWRGILLFVVHAAIASAGGFLLARSYGVRPEHALMVALVAGLNGWMLWWGTTWYAIVASFAWLPWYWLGLRGIAEGRRWSWAGTAVALYLLISGGAPYVVAMAALVALMNLTGANRLRMIGASALGLALSAPAVLMLLEYFPFTARSNAATRFEDLWVVPWRALPGLAVPVFTTEWKTFHGIVSRPALELLGATVPLAAILWSAAKRQLLGRIPRAETALLLLLLVLILLPSAGPFRWSFRWLPLFHLVLAILGAIALGSAKREWSALPARITAGLILLTFTTFHDRDEVSRWRLENLDTPLDETRTYLALYDLDAMVHPELLPGNLPMLAGREFVNGYSPMGLAALNDIFQFDVHGPIPPAHAEQILRHESGRNQLLHHLGIDGLIVPIPLVRRNMPVLSRNGWHPAMQMADCLVFHREKLGDPLFQAALAVKTPSEQQAYAAIFKRRTPQLPVVLLTDGGPERYGPRQLANVVEARNQTTFMVQGKGPKALIVFRRPWLPGWRATIDGKPLPVLRASLLMPAIEIPAGAEGEVRLVYRPRSLVFGAVLAGLALLAMAAVAVRIRGAR